MITKPRYLWTINSVEVGTTDCQDFDFELDLNLETYSNGSVQVIATAEDPYGNVSRLLFSLTKDSSVPMISSLEGLNMNRVNSVNQSMYNVSGSCDKSDAAVTVSHGPQQLGTAICNGTDFEVDLDLQTFADGSLHLSVHIQDSFNNSATYPLAIEKETVAPSVSSLATENDSLVILDNQAAYTISGSCDDNAARISLELLSSSNTLSTTCQEGSFTIDLDFEDIEDGAFTLILVIEDAFGNPERYEIALTKDTTAPSISLLKGERDNTVILGNYKSYTVSGSCDEEGAQILLSAGPNVGDGRGLASEASVSSETTCDSGEFSAEMDLSSLENGDIQLNAHITDSVGYSSQTSIALSKNLQPFVSVWEISDDNLQISLPLKEGFHYDFEVDWGDGTTSTVTSYEDLDKSHTYAASGDYTVTISGVCEAFGSSSVDESYKLQIKSISNLGNVGWVDLSYAFYFTQKLTSISGGDLFHVTTIASMFEASDISTLNVRDWDVSRVTNMSNLFHTTSSADPDVSQWDVSSVTDMSGLFYGAEQANPDVSNWNVSSVTSMSGLFGTSKKANPDVSSWDVSNVTNMGAMFLLAEQANPDVSGWDVSSVTSMNYMFGSAVQADPDMSQWTFHSSVTLTGFFANSGLSIRNYSSFLINLASQSSHLTPQSVVSPTNRDRAKETTEAYVLLTSLGWVF